jgi:hypothetical protein
MRIICLLLASVVLTATEQVTAAIEDSVAAKQQPKEMPLASGYVGGLPFYTAFHQGVATTRLILLKAASDIPELAEYLHLSAPQLKTIKTTKITDGGELTDVQVATLLDENAAVDEELVNPNFYGFLDDAQRERLDRLSLEFDGLAGLSRSSIASRLNLSLATRKRIAITLTRFREEGWLPFFRYEFAGRLPADHGYRKCVFVGEFLAGLNGEIYSHLSADERKACREWNSGTPVPDKVIEAIKRKAPLPEGLFGLVFKHDR